MRRIVIAKALVLIAVGLYLAVGISKASRTEDHPAHPPVSAHHKQLR